MKLRIRETYLIFLIVIGLVSLSLYTTYAMFTATTTIEDVVDFDTSLTLTTSLSEYELITLTGNETQVIEVNVTNSYDSTLCYGIVYEVVSGEESSLSIGIYTEKSDIAPSGTIASGSTTTTVVGMYNGSSSDIILKFGTKGGTYEDNICNLGIKEPKQLVGTEWSDELYYDGPTQWTITENSTWIVPVSGTYQLDIRGGGGGGGGSTGYKSNSVYKVVVGYGGDGGRSRNISEAYLEAGDIYEITIGTGGIGGSNNYTANSTSSASDGNAGGKTSFGELITVEGGSGGEGGETNIRGSSSDGYSHYGIDGTDGSNSGNAADQGSGDLYGGGGGKNGYFTYYLYDSTYGYYVDENIAPENGEDGAVYITYLGK